MTDDLDRYIYRGLGKLLILDTTPDHSDAADRLKVANLALAKAEEEQ